MISKCKKMSTFVILTRGQARALPVILSARTIEEGCKNAGISRQGDPRIMLARGGLRPTCGRRVPALVWNPAPIVRIAHVPRVATAGTGGTAFCLG
jgi:hypothetical protein